MAATLIGMQTKPDRQNPAFWLDQIFFTKSARRGAVVRRSVTWVDREIGRDRFLSEIRRRNFHLIRTADQFIIICHGGPIKILF